MVGGYERAAERLSAALARRGARVVVVTERRERSWPAREERDGYEVRRLWFGAASPWRRPLALAALTWFLLRRGRGFDVWHVHQYGPYAAAAAGLGRLLGRPVVLKLTSTGPLGISSRLGGGPTGLALAALHRRVSACVAVSEETRAEAVAFGIAPARLHLIPNGLEAPQGAPGPSERARAKRALGLGCARLVLCVGRLSPEKNPLLLLDAWAALRGRAREGALLALVGDGPQRESVEAAARRSAAAGSVLLAGSRGDVELWYRAADVCAVSSDLEGLSNSMIEALAAGVPVVSTMVSGSSVLRGPLPAGLVTPVGDAAALARALESLLEDDEARARLAANARAVFESRFSLGKVCEETLALYGVLRALPRP